MKHYKTLAPFVLVTLVVMNNIAESLFSLQLPAIQAGLHTSTQTTEWLISTHLLGFSLGMLCWGRIADSLGRQRAWGMGVLISVGTLCAMFSFTPVAIFFVARFIQGFASSVSSVMSLIIIRDWYARAHDRSKMHARINQSLSLAPIISMGCSFVPMIRGHWHNSFVLLACIYAAMFVLLQMIHIQPHTACSRSLRQQCREIIRVRNTRRSIVLIGMCIGFSKCYFSEMPGILKNISVMQHGFAYSLIGVSAAWLLGAQLAKHFSKHYGQCLPLYIGALWVCLCAVLSLLSSLHGHAFYGPILVGIFSIAAMVGTGIIIPNAMALSMEDHQQRAGVASSIIGCGFYTVSTCMQFLLTLLPHGTLHSMPLLFTVSSVFMLVIAHFYQQSSTDAVDKSVENFGLSLPNLDE